MNEELNCVKLWYFMDYLNTYPPPTYIYVHVCVYKIYLKKSPPFFPFWPTDPRLPNVLYGSQGQMSCADLISAMCFGWWKTWFVFRLGGGKCSNSTQISLLGISTAAKKICLEFKRKTRLDKQHCFGGMVARTLFCFTVMLCYPCPCWYYNMSYSTAQHRRTLLHKYLWLHSLPISPCPCSCACTTGCLMFGDVFILAMVPNYCHSVPCSAVLFPWFQPGKLINFLCNFTFHLMKYMSSQASCHIFGLYQPPIC